MLSLILLAVDVTTTNPGGLTLDNTIHIGEILALLAGARWIFVAGLELRDAVRDMRGDVDDLRDGHHDHENRIRLFEGRPPMPQRRRGDRGRRILEDATDQG